MAIILKAPNEKAVSLKKTPLVDEKLDLQEVLAKDPEIVPLDEAKGSIRLLIIGRELDRIDVLGIDQDGDIYIFETKLYYNTTRREVVAQALDYGAQLWSRYGRTPEAAADFWIKAGTKVFEHHQVDLDSKLREFVVTANSEDENTEGVTVEEAVQKLKNRVEGNLREGRFVFVVVMDELTDDIRTHIDYLNKNSKLWVLGVELENYKYRDLQIVVPTMYGNEATEKRSRAAGQVWREESFLAEIQELADAKMRDTVIDLYAFTKSHSIADPFPPTRTVRPRFNFYYERADEGGKAALFSVIKDGDKITIALLWLGYHRWGQALKDRGLIPQDDVRNLAEINLQEVMQGIGLEGFKRMVEETIA